MSSFEMSEPILVSVVIPVFDGERFLAEAVQSALRQTLTEIEVLVIDDGSRDGSLDLAQQAAKSDARVRVLTHPENANRGVSESRWLGVQQARGTYVAFLDADDLFEPSKLAVQCAAMQADESVVLSHTGITPFGDGSVDLAPFQTHNDCKPSGTRYRFDEEPDFLHTNPICNSTVVARKSALENLTYGFPQLFQFEDWTLWALLATRGHYLFLGQPLTRYRAHAASATAEVMQSKLRFLYSHIECYLTVAALSDDRQTIRKAEKRLFTVLGKLSTLYADAASAGGGAAAELGKRLERLRTREVVAQNIKGALSRLGPRQPEP